MDSIQDKIIAAGGKLWEKGDMRLKDGKLWMCSDPDINRWVCPDDRGWQLVQKS